MVLRGLLGKLTPPELIPKPMLETRLAIVEPAVWLLLLLAWNEKEGIIFITLTRHASRSRRATNAFVWFMVHYLPNNFTRSDERTKAFLMSKGVVRAEGSPTSPCWGCTKGFVKSLSRPRWIKLEFENVNSKAAAKGYARSEFTK